MRPPKALQQKWEKILQQHNLGMDRGKLGNKLRYVGDAQDALRERKGKVLIPVLYNEPKP